MPSDCNCRFKKVVPEADARELIKIIRSLRTDAPQGPLLAVIDQSHPGKTCSCIYWHSFAYDFYCDDQERIQGYWAGTNPPAAE